MPTTSIVSAIVSTVVSAVTGTTTTATVPATALVQTYPADAGAGVLLPPVSQTVTIGKVVYPVAPGLQVRNSQNLIVMPSTIQSSLNVRYQLDATGSVWRVWVLSAAE